MALHEQAKEVEDRARELANILWLRITALWDEQPSGIQALAAVYLARELNQHVIQTHHTMTKDPDAPEPDKEVDDLAELDEEEPPPFTLPLNF